MTSDVGYFDTAPFYGYGRSEHVMGDALRDKSGWVLSTKVGRLLKPRPGAQRPDDSWKRPFPFEPVFDYSYDGAMRSYEDSLQRLGLNRIDILFIHDIDVFTHGADAQPGMHAAAMSGAYKALDELRRNGDIKAIGLGVNQAQPIADALQHGQWDCFLLAGRYTLLEQDPLASLFPALEKHGASLVIGGPFNSGVLVGRETWNYARAPEAGDELRQGDRPRLRRPRRSAALGGAEIPPRPSPGCQRHSRPANRRRAQPDLRVVGLSHPRGPLARPQRREAYCGGSACACLNQSCHE